LGQALQDRRHKRPYCTADEERLRGQAAGYAQSVRRSRSAEQRPLGAYYKASVAGEAMGPANAAGVVAGNTPGADTARKTKRILLKRHDDREPLCW